MARSRGVVVVAMLVCVCCRDGFDLEQPYEAPVPIDVFSTASGGIDDPTVTTDLLELYFNADLPDGVGDLDIWVSTRDSADAAWGPAVVVAELSTAFREATPEISPDGLSMWFASDRPGGLGGYDIWTSSRASRFDPWSPPEMVAELNSAGDEGSPAPNASTLSMVFFSIRDGGANGRDLYLTTRATKRDPWAPPTPVAELNSPSDDSNPFFDPQGRRIYFDSDRAGGLGQRDLYTAIRTSAGDAFGPPEPLGELNSSAHDNDAWVSDDGRYVIFSSDRSGRFELYEARR